MRLIAKTFVKGLVVVVPLVVTGYAFYWLGTTAESVLGGLLQRMLPEGYYLPGLGVLAGFGVIFGVGVLMSLWLTRKLVHLGEAILERIPLVKTLYGSVKDLMSFFAVEGEKKKAMDQVVIVNLGDPYPSLLGFLTREDLDEIIRDDSGEDLVAVYLPMSYQIGGFTVFVPRSSITETDLRVEDGMRFAMTAGVSSSSKASS